MPKIPWPCLELGIELQQKYLGQDVPKDFKISTAGCLGAAPSLIVLILVL
ncbi:hypothetical protein N752_12435 [Desulforamulus aquiferis]|nr:hypothetical protein [Desulforamulus aquiferis]RYD04727.1 hypothetical protein N752_12435 [Desulforamulus aquiferis]